MNIFLLHAHRRTQYEFVALKKKTSKPYNKTIFHLYFSWGLFLFKNSLRRLTDTFVGIFVDVDSLSLPSCTLQPLIILWNIVRKTSFARVAIETGKMHANGNIAKRRFLFTFTCATSFSKMFI